MKAWIVMPGYDYKGLSASGGPYEVFFTPEEAQAAVDQGDYGSYREAVEIEFGDFNEAMWAACNTAYPQYPGMEFASELALKVVRQFLGIDPEVWETLDDVPKGE